MLGWNASPWVPLRREAAAFPLNQAFMQARPTGQQKYDGTMHRKSNAPADGGKHRPMAPAHGRQHGQQHIDGDIDTGMDVPAELGTGAFKGELFECGVQQGSCIHVDLHFQILIGASWR